MGGSSYVIPKLSSTPQLSQVTNDPNPKKRRAGSSYVIPKLSSTPQLPISSGIKPGFVGCVRLSDTQKGWLEPCSSGSEDSSSSLRDEDSSSSSIEVMLEVVKRGEFWGRFVRRPPRPKSKPSIVVPQENDDLDFLDELAIDDQVDTQEDKDIMSEDYLLE